MGGLEAKKVFVKTLGCKVNQVESAYILERLMEAGFSPSSEETSEILILNSCVVTSKAEAETKKIIKKWLKKNPKVIVLTGCYAQKFNKEAKDLFKSSNHTLFFILGQKEKLRIPEILKETIDKKEEISMPVLQVEDICEGEPCTPLILTSFYGHSRAFIKIQDGCDDFCSYCLVPYTRGHPRSVPLEFILKQIEIFIEKGYQEFLLTGIHLGKWGVDFRPPQKLTYLLREIENFLSTFNRKFIVRLSSLEVNEIDEAFLDFLKTSQFIAPHFHLPLQSGSNKILKLMNRHYSREKYLETLEKLYQLFPYATFGADVIVGFPGEEEKDFWDTYELIKNSPLNWLHIFPYSERPGTLAQKLTPKVPPKEIEKRKKLLMELITEKRELFLERELGNIRKALLENFDEKKQMWKALSENYITTYINLKNTQNEEELKGKLIEVKFLKREADHLIGDLVKFV